MNLLNLTPHPIKIFNHEVALIAEIPTSGHEIRLIPKSQPSDDIEGIPCVTNQLDPLAISDAVHQIYNLLETRDYSFAIVSSIVLAAVKDTTVGDQCIAPDTSPGSAVRDTEGNIIGVKGFQRAVVSGDAQATLDLATLERAFNTIAGLASMVLHKNIGSLDGQSFWAGADGDADLDKKIDEYIKAHEIVSKHLESLPGFPPP